MNTLNAFNSRFLLRNGYGGRRCEDGGYVGDLERIAGDPFTEICISNLTIGMAAKAKKVPWTCTDVAGITSGVSPRPCDLLPDQDPEKVGLCNFPTEALPIDNLQFQQCSYSISYY
ncbi:hypothetical protein L1049_014122 [Liquidambar formosana]|uniref:Uncharacterized protein n=1 Tax=Liquidambar formosana TaxID=63359 RepID=A0AAP0WUZ8_LIQFO